jgi:putative phosphoesterase
MRLAIVSDTHSRYARVERVLELLQTRSVDLILHCGDIEDAETVELFPSNTHFVFGNCDTDRPGIRQAIQNIGATLHEPYAHLDLEGVTIAFLHGDDRNLFRDVENSGAYQYLFYGHTHVAREHRTGPTRVINPGALHRAATKTFLILDLPTGQLETIEVE